MKRVLLTLVVMLIGLTALATPPNLHIEKLFDGRYKGNADVRLSIIKDNDELYRSISVSNSPAIAKEIKDAFAKDQALASGYVYNQNGSRESTIIEFENNGHEITIGLNIDGSRVSLYITGNSKAFK